MTSPAPAAARPSRAHSAITSASSRHSASARCVSAQDTEYQHEFAERTHLPYPLLSDSAFALTEALRLPTFEAAGMRLIKRLTVVVADGRIEKVFYPVSHPTRTRKTCSPISGATRAKLLPNGAVHALSAP